MLTFKVLQCKSTAKRMQPGCKDKQNPPQPYPTPTPSLPKGGSLTCFAVWLDYRRQVPNRGCPAYSINWANRPNKPYGTNKRNAVDGSSAIWVYWPRRGMSAVRKLTMNNEKLNLRVGFHRKHSVPEGGELCLTACGAKRNLRYPMAINIVLEEGEWQPTVRPLRGRAG